LNRFYLLQLKEWMRDGLGGTPARTQGVRFTEPSAAAGRGQEQLGRATAVLAYMLRSRPVRAILLAKNRPGLQDLLAVMLTVMNLIETELTSQSISPQRCAGIILYF
jgi:hypothetical protein